MFQEALNYPRNSDSEVAPSFDNWGQLLVDGLVGGVIMLVYGVIFMTPFGLSVVVLLPFAAESASGGAIALAGAVVALLLALVSVALGLAAIYLFPAALAAYAVTGKLSAAFSPSTLRRIGIDRRYLIGVVVAVVINFITQTASSVILITIVGIPLIPFIGFYGSVAMTYAFGAGVAETAFVDAHRDRQTG